MLGNYSPPDASYLRKRFQLRNGQFFAFYRYKNLHWVLDGLKFGFGDLTDDQIIFIQENLKDNEVFEGFNEHHGSIYQQMDHPMVRITHSEILFAGDLLDL